MINSDGKTSISSQFIAQTPLRQPTILVDLDPFQLTVKEHLELPLLQEYSVADFKV